MSFINTQYIPHILGGVLILWILLMWQDNKFFAWIKTYWFYKRSWMSRVSSFFYLLGITGILFSLLDLRGPEEKIKSNIPDQRTIIVIDSSASMLAEDVRPSRFVKSLQLARHFVKNTAGHQIAIVLFSDIQKRIVPFTDDIDLLDSRLAALEKTNSVAGGSNIAQAVSESIQYFETEEEDQKSIIGNILVFTDAEENEGGMDLEIGSNINLAVVGLGTAKGSSIPLRWDDGSFRGYKTFNGEQVITKLDENFLKKMGKRVKNYRYWVANSYSLPTDEIISFFRSSYNKTVGKGDLRIRPVYSHLILIPAILLYCIGVLLGRFKSFSTVVLVCFISLSGIVRANEQEPKKLSPEVLKDLEKMKSGKAERKEVLKTAEKLLRENQTEKASALYEEYSRPDDEEEILFNRATSLLKKGQVKEALPFVQKILKESKDETLKDKMRNNLVVSVDQMEKKKDQQQSKDQKQDQKEDQKNDQNQNQDQKNKGNNDEKDDQSKGQNQKDNKDKKDQQGNEKDSQNKNQSDPSDKDQSKDGKENEKDKNKKDPKDIKAPPRETKPQSVEEKEKMIEQQRKMVKTPAMVKQILNNDRELQKRMMDTSTNERGQMKPKRDW